ncbi:MAG: hypothetical protein MI757_13890 [Pirellulales bacterium]|nr:hypothetical protein [Pirellulales bacterium]
MAVAEAETSTVLQKFVTAFENVSSECKEDHVGLWSVIREVQDDFGDVPPSKVKEITLYLVYAMLQTVGIRAGVPASNGRNFSSWTMTPDEAVKRISEEWDHLGRLPSGGEIVWFTSLPDKQAA